MNISGSADQGQSYKSPWFTSALGIGQLGSTLRSQRIVGRGSYRPESKGTLPESWIPRCPRNSLDILSINASRMNLDPNPKERIVG